MLQQSPDNTRSNELSRNGSATAVACVDFNRDVEGCGGSRREVDKLPRIRRQQMQRSARKWGSSVPGQQTVRPGMYLRRDAIAGRVPGDKAQLVPIDVVAPRRLVRARTRDSSETRQSRVQKVSAMRSDVHRRHSPTAFENAM